MKFTLSLLLAFISTALFAADPVSIRSTNGVSTGLTNYGSTARTNWTWMDVFGFHNTNNGAADLGINMSNGVVKADQRFIVGVFPQASSVAPIAVAVSNNNAIRLDFKNYSTGSQASAGSIFRSDVSQAVLDIGSSAQMFVSIAGLLGGGVIDFRSITTNGLAIRTTAGIIAIAPRAVTTLFLDAGSLTVWGSEFVSTNLTVTNLTTSIQGFASASSNKLASAVITVGASPFNWTNTFGKNVNVFVDGVSVTGTTAINGDVVYNTIGQNTIPLQTNEWVTVTYTIGTPTAKWRPF